MNIKNFNESGQKIILFVLQTIILIICICYIEFVYYVNINPDKYVKEKYEESSCQILDKKMSMKGHILHEYRADFLVHYSGAGVQYTRWISGNGLDRSFTTDKVSQQDLLDQFDTGNNYLCWYNPDVPSMVVLILRHNWSSTFPLFIPSVIGIIVAYYILQSIFEFLGIATIKTREKIKIKKQQKKIK